MRVLVFPLDMDKVIGFIKNANALNIEVVGASSVMNNGDNFQIHSFHKLPFVTDAGFEAIFCELISKKSITHVYTPHGAVWSYLSNLKNNNVAKYTFSLCEPSPYDADWLDLQPSYEWAGLLLADEVVENIDIPGKAGMHKKLTKGQYASLHRQFLSISGQCDELKLLALSHVFRVLPKGDLVEIGSFSGRSSFAIGWLARAYDIGSLVSVDPWDNDKLDDQGEGAEILNKDLDRGREVIDLNKIFWSYIGAISLLDNVGYIKDISENAISAYRLASVEGFLDSPELGRVSLTGNISMLHIDGNHRYDYVCKDIEAWEPFVMPGGWVLLDDYVWAFGDGPKRAGDELLLTGKFDVAFTMSDTLFLRKKLHT